MSKWNIETAEWYAEKYGNYDTNELGVEALELSENSTVVDIDCGNGRALRHASDQVKARGFNKVITFFVPKNANFTKSLFEALCPRALTSG